MQQICRKYIIKQNHHPHEPTLGSWALFVYCYCRLNLYLKLFIVMGVNWIMEIISWAAGGPEYFWYVTDLGNILQGVLIFIIFVWKQKVRHILVRKFCPHFANRSGSQFRSSTRSRPTASHMSSYSYTTTTSVSSHEQFQMKSTGTIRTSDVP